ncbi:MAG: flagellar biosynthesis repressor FlbT [Rhodomicrobium sp.]
MSKPFSINLKSGDRIFVNGAVLRVDRKVSIEFLNDVTFLLEAHVMQPEQTTTPFKQLYFIVQTMLIDPANAATAKGLFGSSLVKLRGALSNQELLSALEDSQRLVNKGRYFEALRILRRCFPQEDKILCGVRSSGMATEIGVIA